MKDFAFILSAVVCVLSAAAIVSRKNPVYSVVFMLPFFLGMTTLFVLLDATFLAAIQMIVYGGAILVVFLFVIMLINLKPDELREDFSMKSWFISCVGAGLLAATFALFAYRGTRPNVEDVHFAKPLEAKSRPHQTELGSVENIAYPLFEKQMIPFELASVLIIVATLGAVLLSKKKM
ncbi:MAG TPA: NADH-quinone oxidoreductase subunit J [Planctomycetota bacterium]|nr:NADH-quinone oxidoreductase subunit J [Planctomycetota bacterium]